MSKSTINTSGITNSILSEFGGLSGTNKRDVLFQEFSGNETCSLLAAGGQVLLKDSRTFAVLFVLDIQLTLDYGLIVKVVN